MLACCDHSTYVLKTWYGNTVTLPGKVLYDDTLVAYLAQQAAVLASVRHTLRCTFGSWPLGSCVLPAWQ